MDREHLAKSCRDFVDSLLASTKFNTLCLNIREPGFTADEVVKEHLAAKGSAEVVYEQEPEPTRFAELLDSIRGKTVVVSFRDLDKHPACIDTLAEHVRKVRPGGKLILISPEWDSDNTVKERELRKYCLFYQRSPEKKRK